MGAFKRLSTGGCDLEEGQQGIDLIWKNMGNCKRPNLAITHIFPH
jgi:hypothetical protein